MAISPVSVCTPEKGNVKLNFEGRKKETAKSNTAPSAAVKTVPVVMLMAMNPSLLNAKLPEMEIIPENIVIAAPETGKAVDKTAYVIAPEIQQTPQNGAFYGWETFKAEKIRYSKNIVSRGVPYAVVYTNYGKPNSNEINNIYFVPRTGANVIKRSEYNPPRVKELIIHDLKNGSQFSTVRTYEDVVDKNGNAVAFREKEIYIDDDTAQHIYDLLYGDSRYTKWINKSYITYRITDDPSVMKEKTVYR